MAVDIDLLNANSINNINTNFQRVETALQETLGRGGNAPNNMNADFDLNSNDLLNANSVHTEELYIDGVLVVPSTLGSIPPNSVGSDQIIDGAVDTSELADGSVTTIKVADEAITIEKLDSDLYNLIVSSDISVANRTELAALNLLSTSVYLEEAGREGMFTLKDASSYTASIAADTQQGLFVASTFDITKVWVRAGVTFLFAEWFGLSPNASATTNSDALDGAKAVAAVVGKNSIQLPGSPVGVPIALARNFSTSHGMRIRGLGNNAEDGNPYYGPTIVSKSFDGGYLFTLLDSSVVSDMDIIPGAGNTGGAIEWNGARAGVERVSCFDLTGTAFSIERTAPNMNLWFMRDVRAVECNIGQKIAQFRNATAYSNGLTLVTGAEYYNASDTKNYRVTVAGNGQTTSSGTLAADIAANPTWWALSSFPYGAPDTNAGYVYNFEISRCNEGIVLWNTSDNRYLGVTLQNCDSYGVQFEYHSFGNEIRGYLEANGVDTATNDVYYGVEAYGNQVWAGGLTPLTVDEAAPLAKNLFTQVLTIGDRRRYCVNHWVITKDGVSWTQIYQNGRIDIRAPAGAQTVMQFETSTGTIQGTIQVTGAGVTTYATSSDYRRKSNYGEVFNPTQKIARLKPRTFLLDGEPSVGFIAHEFAEVFPDSVIGVKDAVDEKGNPIYQQISASNPEVIATIIAEMQLMRKELDELKG